MRYCQYITLLAIIAAALPRSSRSNDNPTPILPSKEVVIGKNDFETQLYIYNGWLARYKAGVPLPIGAVSFRLFSDGDTAVISAEDIEIRQRASLIWQCFLGSNSESEFNRKATKVRGAAPIIAYPLWSEPEESRLSLTRDRDKYVRIATLATQAQEELAMWSKSDSTPTLAEAFNASPQLRLLTSAEDVRLVLPDISFNEKVDDVHIPPTIAPSLATLVDLERSMAIKKDESPEEVERKVSDLPYHLMRLERAAEDGVREINRSIDAMANIPPALDIDTIRLAYLHAYPAMDDISPADFASKAACLSQWLKETKLDSIVTLRGVEGFGVHSIVFKYGLSDKSLPAELEVHLGEQIGERLLRKSCAVFGVAPLSAAIALNGDGLSGFYFYDDGQFTGREVMELSGIVGQTIDAGHLKAIAASISAKSKTPTAIPKDEKEAFLAMAKAFLKPFGAQVSLVVFQPGMIVLRVKDVRSMVIPEERLWENVQICLVWSMEGATKCNVTCMVDGQWGVGISRAPSSDGYYDMEPKYSHLLSEFAGALATSLANPRP